METEHIYVNGEEESVEEALAAAETYAGNLYLADREAMRLRLLTEELLGLLGGITSDDFTAMFWIEGDKNRSFLHLTGKIRMTSRRREELLASARSGKNSAARGIMGKLRDMIAAGVLSMNEAAPAGAGFPVMDFYSAGMETMGATAGHMAWSLSGYRSSLEEQLIDLDGSDAFEKKEPWDELERSVLANLADDVRVSIHKDDVEIIVERSTK
ncbi:MAG: hypothetical protein K6B72_05320 [Lachnospiraceae bacterium]|nr:hypothetical protein [Lachnospiraceae bacterium]